MPERVMGATLAYIMLNQTQVRAKAPLFGETHTVYHDLMRTSTYLLEFGQVPCQPPSRNAISLVCYLCRILYRCLVVGGDVYACIRHLHSSWLCSCATAGLPGRRLTARMSHGLSQNLATMAGGPPPLWICPFCPPPGTRPPPWHE